MGESSESDDDFLKTPAIIYTYARKRGRSSCKDRNVETCAPNNSSKNGGNVEPWDVPAPATPDIGKCELTKDVSLEPCQPKHGNASAMETQQFTYYSLPCHSKKKMCRRSLSLDVINPKKEERVGCRRSLRIHQIQVRKKSKSIRSSCSSSSPNELKAYTMKHRRSSSRDTNEEELESCTRNNSSQNRGNVVSQAASTSYQIATTPKIDVEPWDVPAPSTPDIVTRKRMIPPGKCEPTKDVSREPCLTEHGNASAMEIEQVTCYCQDSNKKTCRRSLSLDVINPKRKARNDLVLNETSEHVGCRRSLRIQKIQVPKKLKKSGLIRSSSSSSSPNEPKGSTERVMKKLARPVLDKSSRPKIRQQSMTCIDGISTKRQGSKCNVGTDEEIRMRQKIEKELLHRQIRLFLSCMKRIQGERKFSQWKGSVMDSIGGAYLAQNVNDTLSSSAFMSLAAKFPREALRVSSPVEAYDEDVLNVKGNKKNAATPRNSRRQRIKKKHDPVLLNVLKDCYSKYHSEKKTFETSGAIDWDAVSMAKVDDISKAIQKRGMNKHLAERIKNCVEELVKNFGSTDMEWIRDVPSHKAKEYLLSIFGLGLKSVECVRLLTLGQKAFPIDRNAGRVAVRLGWVPLEALAEGEEFHLLKEYPKFNSIQMYLWPHLSDLDFHILYELHCQMITFGKLFCSETSPNCYECPMSGGCKYFASVQASKHYKSCTRPRKSVEMDIEDYGLIVSHGTTSMSKKNIRLKKGGSSTSEMASVRVAKKRNAGSLRTEHGVYSVPDHHDLLAELEPRKADEACPYLLAVSTPESLEEDEEDAVYGTLLIPVRTATRGIFPLNGTFFQPNEVFADEESSEVPVRVPKALVEGLPDTTLYCGSSMSTICRGMTNVEVGKCLKSGKLDMINDDDDDELKSEIGNRNQSYGGETKQGMYVSGGSIGKPGNPSLSRQDSIFYPERRQKPTILELDNGKWKGESGGTGLALGLEEGIEFQI